MLPMRPKSPPMLSQKEAELHSLIPTRSGSGWSSHTQLGRSHSSRCFAEGYGCKTVDERWCSLLEENENGGGGARDDGDGAARG